MSLWQDIAHAAFWLELARGDLATWIQLTPYVYAAFEGIHLVGIAFFLGSVFLLDLRLLGLVPRALDRSADRFLLRVCFPAFVVVALSGALLFVPSADRYAASVVFWIKMGVIGGGGANALVLYVSTRRRAGLRSEAGRSPWIARTAATVSILVWLGAIVLGRWMGYESREPPEIDFDTFSFDTPEPSTND